ncbi:TRAP transporter small permease [Kushneria marisflavi]|uniref:TRAP transporter small permease protein n=1 Tax=Kushneria marisflavi TaxID=157779 RepID=A0A240UNA7_9GAMM|nr:TRAP transporter small permease [Kushneria marisflavi]ART62605.1 C4-dicarboxylate ABC transporter permease [Kushneria marisflavi]RKD84009.1 TRAP-type C4-dicarboxylate transport system permease small subunit [Kushneria marisflavi]
MSQTSSLKSDDQHSSALLRTLLMLDRGLGLIEKTIVAGSILVMALLMSAHVVGNIVLGQGITGTYEMTEMLIVIITFVGVGYAARHARHISMSAFYEQLSGQRRKALLILICLGTALLMFYFSYKSIEYVITIHDRGRTSASLQMPLWIVYLALPIGFALAGIQYVLTVIRNLTTPGIWRSLTEQEGYNDAPLPDSENEGADTTRD